MRLSHSAGLLSLGRHSRDDAGDMFVHVIEKDYSLDPPSHMPFLFTEIDCVSAKGVFCVE